MLFLLRLLSAPSATACCKKRQASQQSYMNQLCLGWSSRLTTVLVALLLEELRNHEPFLKLFLRRMGIVKEYRFVSLYDIVLLKASNSLLCSCPFWTLLQLMLYFFTCFVLTHNSYARVWSTNKKIQKCWVVAHHRVGVSGDAQAILKRNKHWNNSPATIAFRHHHTEALHRGRKWRFVKSITQLKWGDNKVR